MMNEQLANLIKMEKALMTRLIKIVKAYETDVTNRVDNQDMSLTKAELLGLDMFELCHKALETNVAIVDDIRNNRLTSENIELVNLDKYKELEDKLNYVIGLVENNSKAIVISEKMKDGTFKGRKKVTDNDEKIIGLYADGLKPVEISNKLNVSLPTVIDRLKSEGIYKPRKTK